MLFLHFASLFNLRVSILFCFVRERDAGASGIGLKIHANACAQQRISLADLVAVNRHEQHLLLSNQHHTLFSTGDSGIEQVAVDHDAMRFQKRHDNRFILRTRCRTF